MLWLTWYLSDGKWRKSVGNKQLWTMLKVLPYLKEKELHRHESAADYQKLREEELAEKYDG